MSQAKRQSDNVLMKTLDYSNIWRRNSPCCRGSRPPQDPPPKAAELPPDVVSAVHPEELCLVLHSWREETGPHA